MQDVGSPTRARHETDERLTPERRTRCHVDVYERRIEREQPPRDFGIAAQRVVRFAKLAATVMRLDVDTGIASKQPGFDIPVHDRTNSAGGLQMRADHENAVTYGSGRARLTHSHVHDRSAFRHGCDPMTSGVLPERVLRNRLVVSIRRRMEGGSLRAAFSSNSRRCSSPNPGAGTTSMVTSSGDSCMNWARMRFGTPRGM